ncbi:alpha/beta-hydrolase [Stipitochalara longipes BDJ]|nr:alpha/beta-hydrolase [Stipitochalara longipes BDJ]
MASNPPAQCCTVGVRHDGEPTGKSIKIGNIEAYVAEPTGSTIHKDAAIVFLPDVIGIWQNSQLMADQFAANGYYTVIPDLFNGDPVELNRKAGFDLMTWLTKGTGGNNPHTFEYVDPIVEKTLNWLKKQGFKKIGSVGYCFGAKYTIRFLAKGKGIDVAFVAHPSFVEESELAAIAGPLSIAAAETDQIFPAEKRHKSETILAETKQPYQINLYSGVVHGFSVRCDTSKKIEKFSKEQAFLQAVNWFDEHLA